MPEDEPDPQRRRLGRIVSVVIVVAAFLTGALVIIRTNNHPRTDDAEVFANFIGIAPQVDGPIMQLHVADNQFVRKGDLLLEIDERPYAYALARAKSEQASLEGQISDERRTIASQTSGIAVAQAASRSAEANVNRSAAAVEEARASVTNAEAGVSRAESDL